jgi:DUF4097 and DUF4098 domain-containing protein YvlB
MKRPTITRMFFAAAIEVVSMAIICGAQAVRLDQTAPEVHQSFDLNPGGTVSVSNISGRIRVTSWGENRVQVDAVKHGGRNEDVAQVEIQIFARPDRVDVKTIYPRMRSVSASVDYDLKVPRGALIESATSTSGDVSVVGPVGRVVAGSTSGNVVVQDSTGDGNVHSTSGRVTAERIGGNLVAATTSGDLQIGDVGGRLTAHTTSGQIRTIKVRDDAIINSTSGNVRVERVGGRVVARAVGGGVQVIDAGGDVNADSISQDVICENVRGRVMSSTISGRIVVRRADRGVRATSVSGNIEISGSNGGIDSSTTNGSIIIRDVESRDVRGKTTSGNVRFQGLLYGDGHYAFESLSGDLMIAVPANSGFDLTAKTFSGSIETDFSIQVAPGTTLPGRGKSFRGTIGQGGAQLSAVGFSGNIYIKKASASPK